MKKYMIRCDIEGVSGVVSYAQAEPGKPEFEFGKKMFMSDLMAMVNGLLEGGADEVWIYDEHYYGRNIDLDALPKNVYAICGKPPYLKDWAGGLDESFEALLLLGFHSKRGTQNALLNHSYEPCIKNININGVSVGEIGVEAAIAGDYNVPLAMISADSEGARECRELIDGVLDVSVKESKSETGAVCYPKAVTYKMIFDAAKEVVKGNIKTKPYYTGQDVCLEITLFDCEYRKNYEKLFKETIKNGIITINAKSMTEAWATYWDRKVIAENYER